MTHPLKAARERVERALAQIGMGGDVVISRADLRTILAALDEQDWRPIETAPRDGTKIDLWVVGETHGRPVAERLVDCWWGQPTVPLEPQWCVIGDDHGDYFEDTVEANYQSWTQKATHWRPLPAPPVEVKG